MSRGTSKFGWDTATPTESGRRTLFGSVLLTRVLTLFGSIPSSERKVVTDHFVKEPPLRFGRHKAEVEITGYLSIPIDGSAPKLYYECP